MPLSFDIWRTLAGIAIFLLGISFLETSLKKLSGRRFKLFLRKQTSNKFKAITGGAFVTALLQSSSVVNLMVLTFVGANVLTMQNALAVTLGANFGTTLTSWIIATLGFKFNIENIALPVTGIAGISMALFNTESRWFNWSRFFLGFGFLFIGLGFMKTGIEELVKNVNLHEFNHSPVIIFFGIGLLITSLIQSSSATVAITLSALYTNAISFHQATAIVLGSEIGTTIKLLLAGAKGNAAKKRVAAGNFLFNTVTVLLVFIFLSPVNYLIKVAIGINDNIIGLVFFQSLINIVCIFLFFPVLGPMGRFLEKRFTQTYDDELNIHKTAIADTEVAIEALKRDSHHFNMIVLNFCLDCFVITDKPVNQKSRYKTSLEEYDHIKYLHGEIHSYYIQIQKTASDNDDIEILDRLMSSVRNCMYAAKSLKDAHSDIQQLKNSSNDTKYNFYLQTREEMKKFCRKLAHLLEAEDTSSHLNSLTDIYKSVTAGYTSTLQNLYRKGIAENVNEIEITTLINFNREIFTSFKALVFGAKDYLLGHEQARYFDELPGFIR
jgi:phosphate:Na+ symporter